ncbi:MAG: carbamoyltransferase HypF, partial [Pseudodonghicola sp.]|nr:carbamoyltransferase HypF [Pseudodonghicola sp.]
DFADKFWPDAPLGMLRQVAEKGLNAPMSSSAGRLFDAFAAVTCFDGPQSYEGEAAMRLEALANSSQGQALGLPVTGGEIDPAPLFRLVAQGGKEAAELAYIFHASLAQAFAEQARALVATRQARAVALSGGCFQNALLLDLTVKALGDVPVLIHRKAPANDGGLAFGQALVAAARHL